MKMEIGKKELKKENQQIHEVGKFQLEKIEERYMVVWYDENGNAQEIGELQIQQI